MKTHFTPSSEDNHSVPACSRRNLNLSIFSLSDLNVPIVRCLQSLWIFICSEEGQGRESWGRKCLWVRWSTLCSKERATVSFLRFSHHLQNILACIWLCLWHRVGNLGDEFFMSQEIPARVLKIFWRAIFTSFYNPERKQVAVQCICGCSITCSGSGLRAGWLLCNCPATKALESPFPTGLLVCNLQHGICLECFPLYIWMQTEGIFSLYFHRLLYIEGIGICRYIMLQTEQYKQVHAGIHRAN